MQFLTLSHRYSPAMHHHGSDIPRRVSTSRSSSVSLRCAIHAPSIVTDEVKFTEASRNGNLVPLYRCIFDDHLTPVLAYRCLVKQKDWEAPSFLFESVEPDSRSSQVFQGRYSIVGSEPALEIIAKENRVTIVDYEKGSSKEELVDNPFEIPKSLSSSWKPQLLDGLPDTFCGGWAGYFSYDTVRYIEKKVSFQDAPNDDHNLPDIHLGLYQDVIVFDHVQKKAYAVHWVRLDCYSSVEEAYSGGVKRLQRLVSKIQNVNQLSQGYMGLSGRHSRTPLKNSSMTNDEYKEKVLKAQEHILAGEIFHIVLSQRFERRTFADPFEVYRSFRSADPSPYMAYLQAKGCILVGSSPEIIIRTQKNTIVNRPLAGTIQRGKNASEDELLTKKLLSDEKECVEHTMLVDMGRNDVGKVSKPGSVKVEKLMSVKRYSHVMHISSAVTGELLEHVTCWDALRASLPVGSVSGAPKVKAMELIDKLEVTRRGPYSGGFGWISFTGEMDIALSLRTMVFPTASHDAMSAYKNGDSWKEWTAYMQAGAGIVADSVPEDEQQECEDKVAGMTCAIDLAESTFLGDRWSHDW